MVQYSITERQGDNCLNPKHTEVKARVKKTKKRAAMLAARFANS